MILVWATVRVRPDRAAAYEAAYLKLQAAVRASEPGTIVYEVAKNADEPHVYKVIELYQDQAAQEAHMHNDLLRAPIAELYDCLAKDPVIDLYETIG